MVHTENHDVAAHRTETLMQSSAQHGLVAIREKFQDTRVGSDGNTGQDRARCSSQSQLCNLRFTRLHRPKRVFPADYRGGEFGQIWSFDIVVCGRRVDSGRIMREFDGECGGTQTNNPVPDDLDNV